MLKHVTAKQISDFENYLICEERSPATINKYVHDVREFLSWINEEKFDKSAILKYKEATMQKYSPKTVNSGIASLNKFFTFCGWHELRTKSLKIQKQIFAAEEIELTKNEYCRLLTAAQGTNERTFVFAGA